MNLVLALAPKSFCSSPLRSCMLLLLSAWLCGCPPVESTDYFQMEIGNQWEYYVTQGGLDGEVWNMEVFDADDNPETGRGDIYVVMTRTEPPPEPNLPSLTVDARTFNLAAQQKQLDYKAVIE